MLKRSCQGLRLDALHYAKHRFLDSSSDCCNGATVTNQRDGIADGVLITDRVERTAGGLRTGKLKITGVDNMLGEQPNLMPNQPLFAKQWVIF